MPDIATRAAAPNVSTGVTEVVRYLTTIEAARYLQIAPGTLEVWRCNRMVQIPYVKVGRCVRYDRIDLDRWLAEQKVGTESDAA